MTTLRQQAPWLACLLAGIWLGIRAGGPSEAEDATAARDQKTHSQTTANGHTAESSAAQQNSSSPKTTTARTTQGTTSIIPPAKRFTLDDLRRLIDTDFYNADLGRLFHDFQVLPKSLAEADLPAAAAMIWNAKHHFLAMMCLIQVLDRWAEREPGAALDWLRAQKGEEHILKMIRYGVLHTVGSKNPSLLWQEIGPTLEWQSEDWVAGGYIGQYFASNPELRQKFLDATTDSTSRYFAINSIARKMADTDPAAAIAWAKAQPHNDEVEQTISNLYRTLAEKNPAAALDGLAGRSGTLSHSDREHLIEGLAKNHPEQLREFIAAGGLKSAGMRELGLIGSYLEKSQRDFVALASEIPAGEKRDAFLSSLSFQLSQQGDTDGAWAALKDIPPSLERRSAMWSYAEGRTTSKNIAEMTSWLGSLPTGSDRDSAIAGFARSASKSQPQMACEWSASIADAVYREDIVEESFQSWHRNNAKAAESWLNGAGGLSADEKARLMEKVSKN